MFTVAYVFRRPEGMTLEDFHTHYRDVHAKVAAALPGLVSYTQHPVRRDAPDIWHVDNDAAFDAISIYTFESDEAAEAAFGSDANAELQEDSVKFIDFDNLIALPVDVRKVV